MSHPELEKWNTDAVTYGFGVGRRRPRSILASIQNMG